MSTVYAAAGAGATFLGPAGVLISLGIESVIRDIALVTKYYNFFSLFVIMLLGISASQRDAKFIALLLPLWAGFCMLVGWLKYPNAGIGFGILVICAALAIMTYMHETVHERFGIAGPGNRVVKIFMFLIILQCVVVFVNTSAIFPSEVQPISSVNSQYTNIDMNQEIGKINSVGGLTAKVVDIASIALQVAYSSLLLLITCLVSIAAFSLILGLVFPWIIQAGAIGVGFLLVMQFAIWGIYLLFIFTLFYKPSPDPGW